MKISHLSILLCLLAAVPTFAQQRPRFFDNFDTSRGVEVQRPEFIPIGAKTPAKTKNTTNVSYRAAERPLVKPTGLNTRAGTPSRGVRMNVTEGESTREMS